MVASSHNMQEALKQQWNWLCFLHKGQSALWFMSSWWQWVLINDRFVSFAVGRFLSPRCSNSLRNWVHWDTYDVVWISLQFEVGRFLSPQFKNSIGNRYTGIWMMCELLVWISLQLKVGIFLSPPCSNSLRNWVHCDAYDVWMTCVD